MSIIDVIKKVYAGYPGGYKATAMGTMPINQSLPFSQPTDPHDIRSRIPALGHREYWYPALPDKDIGKATIQPLRMLGFDIIFFRGKDGQVKALMNACPHRGAFLSLGNCFYEGFVTCPYHGATFDGDGNCVAMLTEGPDSKLPGEMKAWAFPTVTLKGIVFVWMGEGVPVDPREDLPPEMFDEPHTIVRWACHVIPCNWIMVLENTNDAHNAFFVHRNCISVLKNRLGGRPRTPLGYRTKVVGDKTANYSVGNGIANVERYYYDEEGHIPQQMYYPGVDGVWPKHRYRLLWTPIWDRLNRRRRQARNGTNTNGTRVESRRNEDDWQGTRLPGISAKGTGGTSPFRSHRWAVPVERDMTRIVYLNIERYLEKPSQFKLFLRGLNWPVRNFDHNYNFRYADIDAERTCRYDIPEYLSPTDSTVVVIRKVIAEYARGVHTKEELKDLEIREEDIVAQRYKETLQTAHNVQSDNIREGLAQTGF